MKLSNETIRILQNFVTINDGIFFKKGSVISTVSPQKNILADALISEYIPEDFGIYDLNTFLKVISMFKDAPELEFDSKHVIIKGNSNRSQIKYRVTDPSMIVIAPDKRPNLQTVDVKFNLDEKDFSWIIRTAYTLNSPHVAVVGDGKTVSLFTFDANDDSVSTQNLVMDGVDAGDKVFKLIFKRDNLKMLMGDYEVEISAKGIAKFYESNKGLTYYVTLETSSTYE